MTGSRAPRLAVAIAVGVAALATAAGSFESTGPAVVRLTDRQVYDSGGSDAPVGAFEVVRVSLFGSHSKSRPIGQGILTCLHVGGTERSCNGSYVLPRGSIETAGVLQSRLLYTQAIVGGTGLFDNARGTLTVTATQLKPRRELLLFRLTG